MAELTILEEKIAEVLGLAQAAQIATRRSKAWSTMKKLIQSLQRMRDEAEETERRCSGLADGRDGKKTAILDKAGKPSVKPRG